MAAEGRYQILRELGQGGMGVVSLALDTLLQQQVAIKSIRRSDQPYQTWEALVQRLIREARSAARLRGHPNIVAIYDVLDDPQSPSIVMEYVEGQTLADIARPDQPMETELALKFLRQSAAAIDYAGSREIVHRDIKPSNIMVDHAGVVKLMDFGIAKPIDSSSDLTRGLAVGTIEFMSPEQLQAQRVTSRSDQYSLAVVAYLLLTGKKIFEAETLASWCTMALSQMPIPPSQRNPSLPAAVDAVFARAMAKNPEERYPSCGDFINSLEQALLSARVSGPPVATLAMPTLTMPAKVAEQYSVDGQVSPSRRMPGWAKVGLSVLAVAIIVGATIIISGKGKQKAHAANNGIAVQQALPREIHDPSGDMVLVDGGMALLGKERGPVPVDAFYIDKTEVTNQAYLRFCRETGHAPPPGAEQAPPEYPVVNVNFADAQEFAHWAKKRLPTPAEWEKAARGPQGYSYPWGNDRRPEAANLGREGQPKRTLEAANSHPEGASPYGALNMLGNVFEWVATAVQPNQEDFENDLRAFKKLSPPLTRDDMFYQVRGGSFRVPFRPEEVETLLWDHDVIPARGSKPDIGFRCARDR
jgi:eukaryotic-like serine/threonine-protein kinase